MAKNLMKTPYKASSWNWQNQKKEKWEKKNVYQFWNQ